MCARDKIYRYEEKGNEQCIHVTTNHVMEWHASEAMPSNLTFFEMTSTRVSSLNFDKFDHCDVWHPVELDYYRNGNVVIVQQYINNKITFGSIKKALWVVGY